MKTRAAEVNGIPIVVAEVGDLLVGVTRTVGPRILFLGHSRRPTFNLFGVLPDATVRTAEGDWRLFGGHRLWTSPEATPRSYSMDDAPVDVQVDKGRVVIRGNPEQANSVAKTVTLRPAADGGLDVVHTIANTGRWPLRFSCWALSVMRAGGFAVVPFAPAKVDAAGLLPDRRLVFWPYSDPADRRFSSDGQFLFVRQVQAAAGPFKVGVTARPAWAAYCVGGMAFVKSFAAAEGEYPDGGCTVEVYTSAAMLELETLGPLTTVEPGCSVSHTERWRVFADIGPLRPSAAGIAGLVSRVAAA